MRSTTATTQALARVQARLYGAQGLHRMRNAIRRTPDGFSRELKAEVAMQIQRAVFDEWHCQQFLPTEAANDVPILPGAA